MKRVISMVVASLSVAAATVGQSPDRPLAEQGYAGLTLRDIPDGHTVISWIFPGPLQGEGLVAPKFDLAGLAQRIQHPTPTDSSPWASLLCFAPGAARGTLGTVAEVELSSQDALKALERFVVENEELLALEERIGRFNIFDALGIARIEIRHSNFLAWLLDPAESHGQGALFLKAILMDLLAQTPPERRPLSPVELDGVELRAVEIRREWRNIDILITCEEPKFVIAIENKIDASAYNPFNEYEKAVRETYSDRKPMFVFLTTDGSPPPDDDWVPYSYADIHRVLTRVRRMNAAAIGDDVLAFLDHYLRLIGSRFMDDPKIDELCRRIYKNHRQAVQLILERAASFKSEIIAHLEQVVSADERWTIVHRSPSSLYFMPREWRELLPRIRRGFKDERFWIAFEFRMEQHQCQFYVYGCPTTDAGLRETVLERLTCNHDEFGFKLASRPMAPEWAQIYRKRLGKWKNEDPDPDAIAENAKRALDQVIGNIAGVPEALRPILQGYATSAGKP